MSHRIGRIVSAGVCTAVVGGAVAFGVLHSGSAGASSGTAGAAAGSTTTTTTSANKQPWAKPGFRGGRGGRRPFAQPGAFFGGSGTISSITSGGLVVTTSGGSKVTFTTNSSTGYDEGLVSVGRSALSVGEKVVVRPAFSSGSSSSPKGPTGTQQAAAVEIVLPEIAGKVVSVSGGSLVIEDSQGFWRDVVLGASTAYESSGKTAAESAVKVGSYVVVSGDIASNHQTLDASAVAVEPAGSGRAGSARGFGGWPGAGLGGPAGIFGFGQPVPGSPPKFPSPAPSSGGWRTT